MLAFCSALQDWKSLSGSRTCAAMFEKWRSWPLARVKRVKHSEICRNFALETMHLNHGNCMETCRTYSKNLEMTYQWWLDMIDVQRRSGSAKRIRLLGFCLHIFFPPLGGSKFAQNRWLVSKAPTPQATPSLVQVFCQNPNGKSKQSAAASVKPSRRQQELHVLFFFLSWVFTCVHGVHAMCLGSLKRSQELWANGPPVDPKFVHSATMHCQNGSAGVPSGCEKLSKSSHGAG